MLFKGLNRHFFRKHGVSRIMSFWCKFLISYIYVTYNLFVGKDTYFHTTILTFINILASLNFFFIKKFFNNSVNLLEVRVKFSKTRELLNDVVSISIFNDKLVFFYLKWRSFLCRVKFIKYLKIIQAKKLSFKNIKRRKQRKRKRNTKLSYLAITFSKRNMFLNLSNHKRNTILLTTIRKEGFFGRRRTEYTSIFSTVRTVKQSFRKHKIRKLALIYKG